MMILMQKPTMVRILFLVMLMMALPRQARPQATLFDVRKLKVQWEVVENSHQGQSQFLSAFTFTNTSETDLPRSGWTLYFNFVRGVKPGSVTGGVNIERINGDLFRLTPSENFQGLKAGASQRIEFVSSDWVVNFTDAPSGLYVVWNNTPDVGVPVTQYNILPSTAPKQYLRFAGDKVGLITPQILYEQNKKAKDLPEGSLVKVFPSPVEYKESGGSYTLTGNLEIAADPMFQQEANYLSGEISALLGRKPAIVSGISSGTEKRIFLSKTDLPDEAYQLSVTDESITIRAGSRSGIFYGIQSLKMLMPPNSWKGTQAAIAISTVEVSDAPRFGHRAFFVDISRNFQSKDQILKLLDLMALYKLNVLHIHLNDDEGWRVEIPSLPELTQVGARRGHTLDNKKFLQPSFGSGPDVNNKQGTGHYTKRDYIEILRYATERHIRVIPEIETPGHARAAIKSMDARYDRLMKEGNKQEAERFLLRDPQDESVYRSVQGWNDNVINVALPSTYAFLERVVDELLAMYKEAGAPIQTIHFGGDEVPAGVWEKSPACAALMRDNPNVKNTDDLWYYFFGKVNAMLKARGLFLYGWEEVAMRKTKLDGNNRYIPNPDFVRESFQVDVWNNVLGWGAEDLAYDLANAGYKVVLSCVSHLYFDMAYYKAFEEPGYYWGAFVDIDKPYDFIPYDYFRNAKEDRFGAPLDRSVFVGKERLTDYGKANIVGVQGLLWAENITTPERMEYMILPKMLGLAERAWAKDPEWASEKDEQKSQALYEEAWSAFVNTVGKRELTRLDYYHNGYHYRIPAPGATIENGKVRANVQLPGLTIRYTTDGKEPSGKSRIYNGPVAEKGTVKLRAFTAKGRGGNTTEIRNP
jgi:hexosaminidase